MLPAVVGFVTASSSSGVMFSIRVSLVDDTSNHLMRSLSANALDQLFKDKSGREFDGCSSSHFSLTGSYFPGLVSSQGFLSNLLRNLSSNSLQLLKGVGLVVMVNNCYLMDCDDQLTGSRVDDVLDNTLGCILTDVRDQLFVELLDQRVYLLHDMLSNLFTVLLQVVMLGGLLCEVLSELLDMLVDFTPDLLDNFV